MSKIEDEILEDFLRRVAESGAISADTIEGLRVMLDSGSKLKPAECAELIDRTSGEREL